MAGKFPFEKFAKKGAKDPAEPDADDKKKAGKAGKFKAAYSKKFGDKAPPNA